MNEHKALDLTSSRSSYFRSVLELINKHDKTGCKILIMDLFRPDSPFQAQSFVDQYASSESEILQRDFYNSLLAAWTPDEVKWQLSAEGLVDLSFERSATGI